MGIKIGATNADTTVKIGSTTIQSGYIGFKRFYGVDIPILDLFTSAHHAYSLRKLRTAYTGKCLRVRRTTTTPSVTTTTVDVDFNGNGTISLNSAITYVSGTATTATNLGQFCASIVNGYTNPDIVNTNQNIFVVTWFDQSGNSKNPTQSTAGNQPRLVNAGQLEVSGSKPAVRFVRSLSTRLAIIDTTANINNMSSYFVGAYAVASSVGGVGYSLGDGTNRFYFPVTGSSNVIAAYGASINAITLQTGFNLNRKIYELISPTIGSTTLIQGWENGVAKGTFSIVNASTAQILLGNAGGGTNYYDGYIQEVIGWQSNQNRLNKENNINGYWAIY